MSALAASPALSLMLMRALPSMLLMVRMSLLVTVRLLLELHEPLPLPLQPLVLVLQPPPLVLAPPPPPLPLPLVPPPLPLPSMMLLVPLLPSALLLVLLPTLPPLPLPARPLVLPPVPLLALPPASLTMLSERCLAADEGAPPLLRVLSFSLRGLSFSAARENTQLQHHARVARGLGHQRQMRCGFAEWPGDLLKLCDLCCDPMQLIFDLLKLLRRVRRR